MKRFMLAAMISAIATLGSASLMAAHAEGGEGNGPSFPGLQSPNIGIATNFNGEHRVVSTEEHTADVYASQVKSPFPQYGTAAQNRRALAMLQSLTPNG